MAHARAEGGQHDLVEPGVEVHMHVVVGAEQLANQPGSRLPLGLAAAAVIHAHLDGGVDVDTTVEQRAGEIGGEVVDLGLRRVGAQHPQCRQGVDAIPELGGVRGQYAAAAAEPGLEMGVEFHAR